MNLYFVCRNDSFLVTLNYYTVQHLQEVHRGNQTSVESYAGTTLTLRGLQRVDMGAYLCIAANGIPPTKSRRYKVYVLFEPLVRVVSPLVLRAADSVASLQCYVEASPKSLNTWQRGRSHSGGKLLNGSKYTISEEILNEYSLHMNLTVSRLKKNDFGEYTCSAVNAYGRADGMVVLKDAISLRLVVLDDTRTFLEGQSADIDSEL
ncbi:Lachesin [Eumeta japonica]|uniref:Lachesin n=1 Tax=Eumeta variegata TaxID=151549 RepID=A0A4C1X972_EUMVA|nr:Lachesin [Eumeta japonica]